MVVTKRTRRGSTTNTVARSKRGHMAEFPLTLGVVFLIMLFPLINLVSFVCGTATLYLCAHQASHQAACATSFPFALSGAVNQCLAVSQSGLGQFAKIVPVGGMAGSGMNLFLYAVNYQNGSSVVYGPNSPLAPPIDTATNIYEVEARVSADVGPFLNLSGVPFVGTIPLVGKPARVSFVNRAAVEHPEQLSGSPIATLLAPAPQIPTGSGQSLPSSPASGSPPSNGTGSYTMANSAGWNYPGVLAYTFWQPDPNSTSGGYMIDIQVTPTFTDTDGNGHPDQVTLNTTITGQHLVSQTNAPGTTLAAQDVYQYQNAQGQTVYYIVDPGVNYTSSISNTFNCAYDPGSMSVHVFGGGSVSCLSNAANPYAISTALGAGPTSATSVTAMTQFMEWAGGMGF